MGHGRTADRQGEIPSSVSAPSVSGETQPPPEIPGQPPDSVDEVSFGNELRDILNGVQPGRTEEEATLPRHISFALEGETEEEKLSSLRELVVNWPPLRNMESLRDTPVFSSGSPRADIMMVTDAPGLYEEKQGVPLAGPSGQKLDAMLKAMGLSRTDIYLTHLVKYRPALPRQLTNNRPPTDREIEVSLPILREEIMLVRPKVVVALGAIAARGILQSGETPLSALRGRSTRLSTRLCALLTIPATSSARRIFQKNERFGRTCCASWNRPAFPFPKSNVPISCPKSNIWII